MTQQQLLLIVPARSIAPLDVLNIDSFLNTRCVSSTRQLRLRESRMFMPARHQQQQEQLCHSSSISSARLAKCTRPSSQHKARAHTHTHDTALHVTALLCITKNKTEEKRNEEKQLKKTKQNKKNLDIQLTWFRFLLLLR